MKVFRKNLYLNDPSIKDLMKNIPSVFIESLNGFVEECDGLTREECEKLGYEIADEWMEWVFKRFGFYLWRIVA